MHLRTVLFVPPVFSVMRRSTRALRSGGKSANRESATNCLIWEPSTEVEPSRVVKRAKAGYRASEPWPSTDIEDVPVQNAPSEAASRQVLSLLCSMYGRRPSALRQRPVLDTLIETMLSQGTTDAIANRAYAALKCAYPTWGEAQHADVADMANVIRFCRMGHKKASRILQILSQLEGEPSLEYLRELTDKEVKDVLCAFPGVGPKTAACVLMFSMNRADFPVDTHVRRICGRIGWTDPKASAGEVYDTMNVCLLTDIKYEMNLLFYEHGQKTCRARSPKCGECSLKEVCKYFANSRTDQL